MSPALLLVAAIGAAPSAELLDFTAEWCQPCQQMKPIVERLRREGLPVRQVDVDQQRDLAARYKITSIPVFVLVVDGREVGRKVGAQSETTLRRLLSSLPTQPSASAVAAQTAPERKQPWFSMPWGKKEPERPAPPPVFDENVNVRAQSQDQRPAPVAPSAAQDPMETAVRIRVKDARGVDFGSGTVIGSQNGKALVLTCWHIFRDFGESALVEVDLFVNGPTGQVQTFPGKMVKGNSEADVALVVVTGCSTLPVSPLAPNDRFPNVGDHVFSVGCGEGKPPSKLQHTVTRLNPYEGPDTTECTGMPVVGRSGGGLFDTEGHVIGVCFAADREDERGVYAGPTEIHELIDAAGYAALIPPPAGEQVAQADEPQPPFGKSPFDFPNASEASAALPATAVPEASPQPVENEAPASDSATASSGSDATLVALDDGNDMEATIILRPRNRPEAPSEVIVINKVSSRFRRYLKGELDEMPVETGYRLVAQDPQHQPTANQGQKSRPEPLSARGSFGRARDIAMLTRVFDNLR